MKNIKFYSVFGIVLLMLTACSKHPADPVPPVNPDNPAIEQSEGTGIDDLHGSQTDGPAYRRQ